MEEQSTENQPAPAPCHDWQPPAARKQTCAYCGAVVERDGDGKIVAFTVARLVGK